MTKQAPLLAVALMIIGSAGCSSAATKPTQSPRENTRSALLGAIERSLNTRSVTATGMITLLSPNFFQQSSQLQTNITFTGSFDNNRGAAATSMSGIYRPWAGRSTTYAYIQAGHHTALKLGSDPTSCPAPFGLVTAGALNVHRLTRVILLIALHAKATYAGNKAYDGSVADLFAVQAVRTIPTAGLQAGPNTSRVQVKAAFKVWLENRTVTGISGSLRFRLEGGSALQYNSIRLAAHFSDYGRPTSIKLPSKCTRT